MSRWIRFPTDEFLTHSLTLTLTARAVRAHLLALANETAHRSRGILPAGMVQASVLKLSLGLGAPSIRRIEKALGELRSAGLISQVFQDRDQVRIGPEWIFRVSDHGSSLASGENHSLPDRVPAQNPPTARPKDPITGTGTVTGSSSRESNDSLSGPAGPDLQRSTTTDDSKHLEPPEVSPEAPKAPKAPKKLRTTIEDPKWHQMAKAFLAALNGYRERYQYPLLSGPATPAQWSRWARDLRLLHAARPEPLVDCVVNGMLAVEPRSNGFPGWALTVQSPGNLREKFERLAVAFGGPGNGHE